MEIEQVGWGSFAALRMTKVQEILRADVGISPYKAKKKSLHISVEVRICVTYSVRIS